MTKSHSDEPELHETRRTIPELRKEFFRVADDLETGSMGRTTAAQLIRKLAAETARRSPIRKVAKQRHPDPDAILIRKIRRHARMTTDSYRTMSIIYETSTRCVSLALVGRRDGKPVLKWAGPEYQPEYDDDGLPDPCA